MRENNVIDTASRSRVLLTSGSIGSFVKLPEEEFEVVVLDGDPAGPGSSRARGGIEAMICFGVERIDAGFLDQLPDLKLIAVLAAGTAGIDFDAVRARGIAVTNAGDINAGDVADFAVTLYLAHRRDVIVNDRWVREGRWPTARPPLGRSIAGERVGIVGLGHIGRAVAERLAVFGCDLAWWGPNSKPDAPWPRRNTLIELAEWAETLIVTVKGVDDTRGLVTREVMAALGSDGLIVNVSRGFVIDESAMLAALHDGSLGGAALDVFEQEPIDGAAWADVPNVIMAPHVSGATQAALAGVARLAVDNIRAHFAGRPLRQRVA